MALDQEYFDSIQIDLVRKKYYNANKVHAVFDDIRRQAEELTAENAALRRELSKKGDTPEEITDAVVSAQGVYRVLLEKANQRADAILSEAEEKRRALESEAQQQRDYAVHFVEDCLTRVREQQQAAIDELNSSWQRFLCGLYPEQEPKKEPEAEAVEDMQARVPDDLDARIKAIAHELFDVDVDETGEEV